VSSPLSRQPNAVSLDPIQEADEQEEREVPEFDRCVVGLGCEGTVVGTNVEERVMKRTIFLGTEAWYALMFFSTLYSAH
jgi:hypothetical protein